MKIFRFLNDRQFCLGLELNDDRYNLSKASPDLSDISTWLSSKDPVGGILDVLDEVRNYPITEDIDYCPPLDVQEVWASGVTYLRSRTARIEESEGGGDFYDAVYEAERPELFFKSTARRVVTDGEAVRIRRDSRWNVPEPELVLVLAKSGRIVGYSIGNDMSSRSIEGE